MADDDHDLAHFWMRKTKKVALSVLLVASSSTNQNHNQSNVILENNIHEQYRDISDNNTLVSAESSSYDKCSKCIIIDDIRYKVHRGTNMEVSMPTGSLCAERNAIGSALASDLSLKREQLVAIAVLSVRLGDVAGSIMTQSRSSSRKNSSGVLDHLDQPTAKTSHQGTSSRTIDIGTKNESLHESLALELGSLNVADWSKTPGSLPSVQPNNAHNNINCPVVDSLRKYLSLGELKEALAARTIASENDDAVPDHTSSDDRPPLPKQYKGKADMSEVFSACFPLDIGDDTSLDPPIFRSRSGSHVPKSSPGRASQRTVRSGMSTYIYVCV